MNRTYKVIWSKARHCYVVVSELTKSQHKSSSKSELISTNIHQKRYFGKAAVAAIVAGLLTFGGVAYSPVLAADNTAGSGDGVAIGTNSNAPKKENVAIGKGATIKYSNGESKSTGDVAVGSGAVIDNYASQGGSIAIGNNVSIENMAGQQEKAFGFG
ncbi:ESPR domain-containing protein, partial [uncultured Megasphaera sp.]